LEKEMDAPQGGHGRPTTTIIINGTAVEAHEKELSFEQLVDIADPGHSIPADNYVITYSHKGEDGTTTLMPGETVKLKNGMMFDVHPTNRS
jgi:hypothetical protein